MPAAPASSAAAPAAGWTEGEVRAVDKAAGTVTLRHGAIANIGMAPMTMVFVARDRAALENLKAGDKVHFRADFVNGQLTATEILRADPTAK